MDMEDVGYTFATFKEICEENNIPQSHIGGFWGYCNDTARGFERAGTMKHYQQYQREIGGDCPFAYCCERGADCEFKNGCSFGR